MRTLNIYLDKMLFAGTALFSMLFFIVILGSVLLRSFKIPIPSAEELSRLFFVWACFLAAAITYRRKAHVGFDIILNKLPENIQRALTLITYLLIFGFAIMLLIQSVYIAAELWPTRYPVLGISRSWLYLPLSVCCLCLTLYTIEFFNDTLRPHTERNR